MAIPPVTIPRVMMTSAGNRPDGRFLSVGDGGQRHAKFVDTVCLQGTPVKQLADSFSFGLSSSCPQQLPNRIQVGVTWKEPRLQPLCSYVSG
jgi:hypothetical protein